MIAENQQSEEGVQSNSLPRKSEKALSGGQMNDDRVTCSSSDSFFQSIGVEGVFPERQQQEKCRCELGIFMSVAPLSECPTTLRDLQLTRQRDLHVLSCNRLLAWPAFDGCPTRQRHTSCANHRSETYCVRELTTSLSHPISISNANPHIQSVPRRRFLPRLDTTVALDF